MRELLKAENNTLESMDGKKGSMYKLIRRTLVLLILVTIFSCNQIAEGIYYTQINTNDTILYSDYKYEIDTKNRRVFLNLNNEFMDGHYVVKRDGKVFEEFTIDEGLLHGEYLTFYNNGMPDSSQYYQNSVASGPSFTFYENGKLRTETSYLRGKRSDVETHYTIQGDVELKTEVLDGVVYKHQYQNGNRAITEFEKELEGELFEMIVKYTSFDTIDFIIGKKTKSTIAEFYVFSTNYEVLEIINGVTNPERTREIFNSLATMF